MISFKMNGVTRFLLIALAATARNLAAGEEQGLKPKFEVPNYEVTLESGTMQHLRCYAEGEKPITHKWYNQNEDEITGDHEEPVYVSNGERISYLVFNTLTAENEGSYTCTASNAKGQASKKYFIRVPPPSDGSDTNVVQGDGMSQFRDAKVLEYTNRSVTFNIVTSGPAKYIGVKYREGKRSSNAATLRLDPVPENIYEIDNLPPSGLYSFQFRTVPSESDDWSREYNVTLLPDVPEIILQNTTDRSVKLQWFVSTDDFLRGMIDRHQIKYFPVKMEKGNSWNSKICSVTFEVPTCVGSSYTILELEQRIFYQIEVRAHTDGGYGEPWRQKVYLP